jgi:hypothetical protein
MEQAPNHALSWERGLRWLHGRGGFGGGLVDAPVEEAEVEAGRCFGILGARQQVLVTLRELGDGARRSDETQGRNRVSNSEL